MSYEQARKDIQTLFSDKFDYLDDQYIAWDNVEFEVPNDSPWIRVSIANNTSRFVSFGPNRRTRRFGLILIQIFVPENSETLISDKIMDKVVEVFETNLISQVVFQNHQVIGEGIIRDGWFQINLSFPFYFDDITSISGD